MNTHMTAARAVWIIANGDPGVSMVLHRCNGGSGAHGCINIRHLYLGDHMRNRQDMLAAGRARRAPQRGSRNNHAKLTETAVREIRKQAALGELHRHLADVYGVKPRTIAAIVNRENWAWLPDDNPRPVSLAQGRP